MMLPRVLRPSESLTDVQIQTGLRWLTLQGTVAMGLDAITSGGFLAAYALALGADNLQIGVLAALPFLTQPLQLPAILLIERLGARKAISVMTFAAVQLIWIPVALIPFWIGVPSSGAMAMLLGLIAIRSLITAPLNAAWNGWLKDLVPQKIMGSYFARRLVFASVVGIGLSIAAGVFADIWRRQASTPQEASYGYAFPLLAGALTLGLLTPIALLGMPEPKMVPPPGGHRSLWKALGSPFKDRNYSVLIRFRFLWALALNLAVPFFAVYMLDEIGLSVSMVMLLTAFSQAANIAFLPVWGRLVDRLGAKGVLMVCCSLYVLVVLGWTFTTQPDRYFLTIPLLVILHILAGVATAGLNVSDGTLAFKLAPRGEGTAYLAAASLAVNFGAALGPLLGGRFADFFADRHFTLNLRYSSTDRAFNLSPLDLTGFDFLFGVSFLLGVLTISQLGRVREEGEATKEMVMHELLASARHARPMSTVPGNSLLASFPLSHIRSPILPGLDVAVGVAAYEVSQAAHAVTVAALRGAHTTARLVHGLERALLGAMREGEHLSMQAVELARAVSHGAARAGHQEHVDIRSMAAASTEAVLRAFGRSGEFREDLVRAAAHGFVRGVAEAGGHPGDATRAVINAAQRAATQAGADPDKAVVAAAQAAVEAADFLRSERCGHQVRDAIWAHPAGRRWLLGSTAGGGQTPASQKG